MRVNAFAMFIIARDAHRIFKETGKWPKHFAGPDPIIAKYRFCNVRREDDYVTRWIKDNWRNGHDGYGLEEENYDPDLWFAMCVARLFNEPATLEAIGYPVPWKPEQTKRTLQSRKAAGMKIFNAAYIVSTNGRAMDKIDYVIQHVLNPLWAARKRLRYDYESLLSWHELLMEFNGFSGFMAAQVVADVKHSVPWENASDWHSFAASGPGSRRGLNRVMGRAVSASWKEYEWHDTLTKLRDKVLPLLPVPIHALDAQDIQNCLCEYDKYERARLGEGEPKQLYKPRKENDQCK